MKQRSTLNRGVGANGTVPEDEEMEQFHCWLPKPYANAIRQAVKVTGRKKTKIFTMLVDMGIKRIMDGENSIKITVK